MTELVRRLGAIVVALALSATGCSVTNDAVDVALAGDAGTAGGGVVAAPGESTLDPIGPIPASSHWHAGYIVRICDDVLAPFDSTDDPLGIHSHADGLMHIHPFVPEAGFEQATLSHFADAMGFELGTGELVLPGGGVWRDGDECNGVPGRVFVDRWSGPGAAGSIERIFDDPQDLRFEADGELYQIAFAPADSPPVVPPSLSLLPQVMPAPQPAAEPWVDVDPLADTTDARIAVVTEVTAPPCRSDQTPERVRVGEPACFTLSLSAPLADVVRSAAPGAFNREPALDLRLNASWLTFLAAAFGQFDQGDGIVLAVVVDGFVITAPLLRTPPATTDRLVIAGGFSDRSATELAELLDPA